MPPVRLVGAHRHIDYFQNNVPPSIVNDSIRLKFDKPLRVNEPGYLHDRVSGLNVAEELSVNARHRLPIVDARQEGARAIDMSQSCPQFLKRRADDFETATGLGCGIPDADSLTVRAQRRRPGDCDQFPSSNGA